MHWLIYTNNSVSLFKSINKPVLKILIYFSIIPIRFTYVCLVIYIYSKTSKILTLIFRNAPKFKINFVRMDLENRVYL